MLKNNSLAIKLCKSGVSNYGKVQYWEKNLIWEFLLFLFYPFSDKNNPKKDIISKNLKILIIFSKNRNLVLFLEKWQSIYKF